MSAHRHLIKLSASQTKNNKHMGHLVTALLPSLGFLIRTIIISYWLKGQEVNSAKGI